MAEQKASSWIKAAVYIPATATLIVETRSAKRYTHKGVSQEIADEFFGCDSLGQAYNALIKGRYEFDTEEATEMPADGPGVDEAPQMERLRSVRPLQEEEESEGQRLNIPAGSRTQGHDQRNK